MDKKFRLIVLYATAGFSIEVLNWILIKNGVRNNMPGLHFYIMFEFLVWSVFYILILNGYIKKIFLVTGVVVFEVFCLVNMIFIQKLTEYPVTRSVEKFITDFNGCFIFYKDFDRC